MLASEPTAIHLLPHLLLSPLLSLWLQRVPHAACRVCGTCVPGERMSRVLKESSPLTVGPLDTAEGSRSTWAWRPGIPVLLRPCSVGLRRFQQFSWLQSPPSVKESAWQGPGGESKHLVKGWAHFVTLFISREGRSRSQVSPRPNRLLFSPGPCPKALELPVAGHRAAQLTWATDEPNSQGAVSLWGER